MQTYHFDYKSTHYYLIDTGNGLLAFDAGWPGTYGEYKDGVKSLGFSMKDLKWVIASHFHIDHAGLVGQFQKNGIECFVFPNQLDSITDMEELITRKGYEYYPVLKENLTLVQFANSRDWLKSIGIDGEVIQTDGHGDICVTVILDSGEAFIGDLPPHYGVMPDDQVANVSWDHIKEKGGKYVKPAHAEEYMY